MYKYTEYMYTYYQVWIYKDNELAHSDRYECFADAGGDVHLHCVVRAIPVAMANVTWFYQASATAPLVQVQSDLVKDVKTSLRKARSFRGERDFSILSTLKIDSNRLDDADGLYYCHVKEVREPKTSYRDGMAYLHVAR